MPQWTTFRPESTPHPFALSLSGEEWVIVSGLGGHDPATGEIAEDVPTQARVAIETLNGLLEQAGSSLSEIVYFRPYVTQREYAFEMDGVLREMLPDPKPAAGALIICELADPRMKLEFECWAQRGARLS